MRKVVWLLCLFLVLKVASAQDGFLRFLVRDESDRPVQAVVDFHPQTNDFCKPWDAQIISWWYSLFLTRERELGREPSLREWSEWLIKMGIVSEIGAPIVTDEKGEMIKSVRPDIYSVYAWSPGYGVACAHYVLVRPNETAEVTLTLHRVPITMLQAQLVLPSPLWKPVSLKLEQNGMLLPITPFLFSEFVLIPLAQWHKCSPNIPSLGEFTAVFELDEKEARRSFQIERWGEIVDLGTLEFKPRLQEPTIALKVPVTVQVFWSDRTTPAAGVAVRWVNVKTDSKGQVQIELPSGGQEVNVWVPKELWDKGVSSLHWLYITPTTKEAKIVLPKPAMVQGFVRYEDGTPVVDAEVEIEMIIDDKVRRILGEPNLRTRTNERGAFAFPHVPPGKFEISVSKLAGDYYLWTKRYLTIKEGDSVQVDFTLSHPSNRQLVGEVKLPSGEPAAGVAIIMLGKTLFTDSKGRFQILRIPTRESFFAFLPSKGSAWRWLTIFPSTEPMSLSLTLENATVTGQIVDEESRPIPEAVVRLRRAGFYFTGLLASHTDAEGKFAITQVPSGEWSLVVEGPVIRPPYMYPFPSLLKTISVPKDGVVNVGMLKVSTKLGQIIGRIVFPSDFGKREGERAVKIYLQRENCEIQELFFEVSPSKPEFLCPSLPSGIYWVLAKGSGWVSEPQKIIVPETGGSISVTLLLQRAGSLKVKVRNAKTQKPITAGVILTDANGLELANEFADSEGEVNLENIPAGTHTLRVWRELFRTFKVPVVIKTGETATIEVALEPKT